MLFVIATAAAATGFLPSAETRLTGAIADLGGVENVVTTVGDERCCCNEDDVTAGDDEVWFWPLWLTLLGSWCDLLVRLVGVRTRELVLLLLTGLVVLNCCGCGSNVVVEVVEGVGVVP